MHCSQQLGRQISSIVHRGKANRQAEHAWRMPTGSGTHVVGTLPQRACTSAQQKRRVRQLVGAMVIGRNDHPHAGGAATAAYRSIMASNRHRRHTRLSVAHVGRRYVETGLRLRLSVLERLVKLASLLSGLRDEACRQVVHSHVDGSKFSPCLGSYLGGCRLLSQCLHWRCLLGCCRRGCCLLGRRG